MCGEFCHIFSGCVKGDQEFALCSISVADTARVSRARNNETVDTSPAGTVLYLKALMDMGKATGEGWAECLIDMLEKLCIRAAGKAHKFPRSSLIQLLRT